MLSLPHSLLILSPMADFSDSHNPRSSYRFDIDFLPNQSTHPMFKYVVGAFVGPHTKAAAMN